MLNSTTWIQGKNALGFSWQRWSIGRRPPTLVGVDIGSRAIKLLELRAHSQGYAIVKCGMDTLPYGVVPQDHRGSKDDIIATIRGLAQRLRISGRAAAIALSGSAVYAKHVTVPRLPVEELEEYMVWESRHYLPPGLEDACVDFHILPDGYGNRTAESEQTILLIAAKRDSVEQRREILEGAGLVPTVLDMTGLALCNVTSTLSSDRGCVPILVINCGMSMMNMAVIHQGVPVLLRDVPMGGRELVAVIQSWKHCTESEAEQQLFQEAGESLLKEEWDRLYAGIIGEAQRTLDFCETLATVTIPRHVVLYGGLALAFGLQARLQQRLGLSVELGNPFRGMDMSQVETDGLLLRGSAPLFGVAMGLAGREKGDR